MADDKPWLFEITMSLPEKDETGLVGFSLGCRFCGWEVNKKLKAGAEKSACYCPICADKLVIYAL